MGGFYHGLNGVGIAAARLGLGPLLGALSFRRIVIASGFAAVAMLTALLGLGGVWFDVGDVQASAFARLARDLLGLERVALAP